jgi:hypothetical protein
MTSRTGWVENGGKVGVGIVMGHFPSPHTIPLFIPPETLHLVSATFPPSNDDPPVRPRMSGSSTTPPLIPPITPLRLGADYSGHCCLLG